MNISRNYTGFELKGFYGRSSDGEFKAIMPATYCSVHFYCVNHLLNLHVLYILWYTCRVLKDTKWLLLPFFLISPNRTNMLVCSLKLACEQALLFRTDYFGGAASMHAQLIAQLFIY